MTTKRIKVKTTILATREEAERTMTDLAATANEQRRLTAERDALVLKINQDFESALCTLQQQVAQLTNALHDWADTNPEQFPRGKMSIEMTSGTLGYRTGTPKLSLLSRAFNWERVLGLVEQYWPGFIRIKKEVDKEGLLNQYSQATDKSAANADLQRLGLKVVQDESFFIEPKLSESETRISDDDH